MLAITSVCALLFILMRVGSYCSFQWDFMLGLLFHFTPLVNTIFLSHLPSTLRKENGRINELQPRNNLESPSLLS